MSLTSEKSPVPFSIFDLPTVSPPPFAFRATFIFWPLLHVIVPLPEAVLYSTDQPAREKCNLHLVLGEACANAGTDSASTRTAMVRKPVMGVLLSLRKLAVEPHDQLFDEQHHHYYDNEHDDPVIGAHEAHRLAEVGRHRFQDHELRSEQHQPREEEPEEGHPFARPLLEERADLVLHPDRRLEQHLQQQGGEQRDGERVDEHLV